MRRPKGISYYGSDKTPTPATSQQQSQSQEPRTRRFDFSGQRVSKALRRTDTINVAVHSPRPHHHLAPLQKLISPSLKKQHTSANVAPRLVLLSQDQDPDRKEKATLSWRLGECLQKDKVPGCSIYKGLNLLNGQLMIVYQIEKESLTPCQLRQIRSCAETLVDLEKHPNLVDVLAVRDDGDLLSVFSEYVPCGNVNKLLDQFGALDERVVRTFCAQMFQALQHLHTKKIVLNLLTTSMIQVAQNSRVKVSPLTSIVSDVIVCPKRNVFVTDIKSLGHIMIEMLTGGGGLEKMSSVGSLSPSATSFLHKCLAVDGHRAEIDTELAMHDFIVNAETSSTAALIASKTVL